MFLLLIIFLGCVIWVEVKMQNLIFHSDFIKLMVSSNATASYAIIMDEWRIKGLFM